MINELLEKEINRAWSLAQNQAYLEAEASCKFIINNAPNEPRSYFILGSIYNIKLDYDKAIFNFKTAVLLNKNNALYRKRLALCYKVNGMWNKAVTEYKKSIQLSPIHETYIELGETYECLLKLDKAVVSYEKSLLVKDDNPLALVKIARIFAANSNKKKAIEYFFKAININPLFTRGYKTLAKIIPPFSDKTDMLIELLESMLSSNDLSIDQKASIHFSLITIYSKRNDDQKIKEHLFVANKIRDNTSEFDIQLNRDLFVKIKETFSTPVKPKTIKASDSVTVPIFIVGMPRSGSSLVEKILSSHQHVTAIGETPLLSNSIFRTSTSFSIEKYPTDFSSINKKTANKIRSSYLKAINNINKQGNKYITDKELTNFTLIGVIKNIFPNAKIIHCKRHPMDICFSCFKNDFTGSHSYIYSLESLGEFYLLYHDLMAHWTKIYSNDIFEVNYEYLVVEPRDNIEKLLNYCGLEWDDRCINHQNSTTPVFTSSIGQVDQKLYTSSISSWMAFAHELAPLLATFKKAGLM